MENATCTTVSHFARIGQNVSICCPVRSYPPPIVTWKKNGTVLLQGKDTFYTVILDKDNKFGNYTCAATDGKASMGPVVITVMKEVGKLRLVNRSDAGSEIFNFFIYYLKQVSLLFVLFYFVVMKFTRYFVVINCKGRHLPLIISQTLLMIVKTPITVWQALCY